ncbi:hypothetical protein FB451DRAFT_255466 [Mycena latifolia]|nr:hypothetical protein FB451DRAFT_255466 [Mycena latifolia]
MDVVPTRLTLAVLPKEFLSSKRWFMKPWSTKEIAAAADRLGSAHADVIARMVWCGPVVRHLFQGDPTTLQSMTSDISRALSGNIFAQPDIKGTQPVHRVFLVAPAVVKDDGGRRSLVREDYFTGFLTPAVAAETFELAESRMDRLQQFVAQAFDVSTTRGVADRLVEGLMHRAVSGGILLPAVFGAGEVAAATLELLGKANGFVAKGVPTTLRPIYLRPLLPSFVAVDAMLVASPNRPLADSCRPPWATPTTGTSAPCSASLPDYRTGRASPCSPSKT